MPRRAALLLAALAVPMTFAQAWAQNQTAPPPTTSVPMPPGMNLPPQSAQPAPATPAAPAPAAAWEARQTADIQALDKVDEKTATLTVPVNQTAQFGFLAISVRACLVRPADQAADATAYLDIIDPRSDATGFHGWMFANEPAISMLEHPVYDVRLIGCH